MKGPQLFLWLYLTRSVPSLWFQGRNLILQSSHLEIVFARGSIAPYAIVVINLFLFASAGTTYELSVVGTRSAQ